MKMSIVITLELSPNMHEVLSKSADNMNGLLLAPINQGLKGYFKDHLKIIEIKKTNEAKS